MTTVAKISNELADEWLELFDKIPWCDHADSIQRSWPRPCGETTSIETSLGLLDVSDSQRWANEPDGDIEVVIEVYDDPEGEPVAVRSAHIRRPE